MSSGAIPEPFLVRVHRRPRLTKHCSLDLLQVVFYVQGDLHSSNNIFSCPCLPKGELSFWFVAGNRGPFFRRGCTTQRMHYILFYLYNPGFRREFLKNTLYLKLIHYDYTVPFSEYYSIPLWPIKSFKQNWRQIIDTLLNVYLHRNKWHNGIWKISIIKIRSSHLVSPYFFACLIGRCGPCNDQATWAIAEI